ncbi:MAG: serine/threonine protein kinase [Deltaproteobacteria bacterium]|nr:serine/threonine protein kinase [Deltaproteobacteria bacterium]
MSREPETIGRYRVQRSLGAGAMGAVYLAEDPLLKRPIAIKIVQAVGVSAAQARDRFRREAEISARLNHPNVITIYDVGEDAQWGPFLAMEYVDGESLSDRIRGGGLDDAARLRILAFALQGLEAAHAAGIVHRDVKPSNVMVGRDGRVKLMDFGIARGEDTGLTATGAVLGTPAYMAPEQLKGVTPSAVTDRYAFAVMAFELFTAQRPFQADTASAMFYSIVNNPPRIPEDMPPALASVFRRALAKNPTERPPTLRAFFAELLGATALDPSARSRLAAMVGVSEPPDGAARSEARVDAEVERAAVVTPAELAPGLSAGKLLGIGGAVVLAAGAIAALLLWPQAREQPGGRVELAEAAPPRSAAAVTPGGGAAPTAPPPAPTAETAPTPPPTPAPPPTLPPATVPPEPTPEASRSTAPPAVARVERPPEPPRLAAMPAPPLTSRELEDRIRRELRRRDLTHVVVRVDEEHRVRLKNLSDSDEERAARSAVAAAAPELQVVSAEIRQPPAPTAAPAWGVIHGEGAERSD